MAPSQRYAPRPDPDLDRVEQKEPEHGRDHRHRLAHAVPVQPPPFDDLPHDRGKQEQPDRVDEHRRGDEQRPEAEICEHLLSFGGGAQFSWMDWM